MSRRRIPRDLVAHIAPIVLEESEIVWTTDDESLRMGDGETAGGIKISDAAIRTDAVAARDLANHYSNDDTDTDIPGAAPGERGAKFWNGKAEEAADRSETAADEAEGVVADVANGLVDTDAQTGRNRDLINALLQQMQTMFIRIGDVENGQPGQAWVSSASIQDDSVTASFNGAVMDLVINDAYKGGVLDVSKIMIEAPRSGFQSNLFTKPSTVKYDETRLGTVYIDQLFVNKAARIAVPTATGQTIPNTQDGMARAEPAAGAGKVAVRMWLEDIIGKPPAGYDVVLVLKKGWYTNGANVSPAQTIVLSVNSNNVVPPVPLANLVSEHRTIVGNALTGEIVAAHYFGRNFQQVAAIEVRATDGTQTVRQVIYGTIKSPRATDRNPVLVYAFNLNITALADGKITLNWRAIPWVGSSASIFDSASMPDNTRDPGPRYFWKNVSLFASPRVVYITSGGNDTTCTASQDDAAARAAPAATLKGAMEKAQTLFAGSGGAGSVRYRFAAGTWDLESPTPQTTTKGMGLVFENDPLVDPTTVILRFSTFSPKLNTSELFSGITRASLMIAGGINVLRQTGSTGNFNNSLVAVDLMFSVATFDNSSVALTFLSNCQAWWYSVEFLNPTTQATGVGGNRHCLYRGVKITGGSTATPATLELTNTVGCLLTRVAHGGTATVSQSYLFLGYNSYMDVPDNGCITFGTTTAGVQDAINNVAIVQNMFERLTAVENITLRPSGDKFRAVLTHFVKIGNTFTGAYLNGRENTAYDETLAGYVRNHRWFRDRNNINVLRATKGEYFLYVTAEDQANAYLHTGNYQQVYGVGIRDNFYQYVITPNARPEFHGQNTIVSTPIFTAQATRPGFVDDRSLTSTNPSNDGSTVVYAAGSTGGNYKLGPTALARSILAEPLLSHGLDGLARARPDVIGCYVGSA